MSKSRNGKLSVVASLAIFTVALTSGARAQTLDQIVEGAKKEGQLVWYDSTPADQAEVVIKEFNKKYPFIKVAYTELEGGVKAARVLQESMAGGPTADVMTDTAVTIKRLNDQKFIRTVPWKTLNPAVTEQMAPTPQSIIISAAVHVFIYNSNKVAEKDVPKTYEALLDARWKNHLSMWARAVGLVSMYASWKPEEISAYGKKLAGQQVTTSRSAYGAAQAVGSGEVDIGLFIPYHSAWTVMERGAPVKLLILEPIGIVQTYGFVAEKGRNPNAGMLFMSWLGSKEGALAYEAVSGRPNIFVPETKGAQLLAGKKLSMLDAEQEVATAGAVGALEAELSKMFQSR